MAQLPPLPSLSSNDALLLQRGDSQFAQFQTSFNTRTEQTPQLRALCKTANGVSVMVKWCRSNNLPFAVRCGGHSYEGFSQSMSVVIDTRLISTITVNKQAKTATVGGGSALGQLYKTIAPLGFAFPVPHRGSEKRAAAKTPGRPHRKTHSSFATQSPRKRPIAATPRNDAKGQSRHFALHKSCQPFADHRTWKCSSTPASSVCWGNS
jgi:hypothetical protein